MATIEEVIIKLNIILERGVSATSPDSVMYLQEQSEVIYEVINDLDEIKKTLFAYLNEITRKIEGVYN